MSSNRLGTGSVLWEVIAPVVRWPLWSPMRFFLVLACVAALLVGWSRATTSDAPAQAAELEAPSDATAAAGEFMGAWGDPTAERGEWRAQVQSMGTDELDQAWARTDPKDIPVSITREINAVEVVEDERVVYSIVTDGPRVQLVLVKEPAGWKVDSVEPEATA